MWKMRSCGRREVVEDEKMWTTTREKMWERGEEEKKKKGVGDIVYIGENKASDPGDLVSKTTLRVGGVGRSFLGWQVHSTSRRKIVETGHSFLTRGQIEKLSR